MKIKQVSASVILDSRKEKTILVSLKTNIGNFSASSPIGKSTGKYEAKSYRKTIDDDIKKIKQTSGYFSEENFTCFDCLRKVEDILDKHVGANTLFAFESAVLKAITKDKKKEVWQLINENVNTKKFPRLVGNCIGGGKHSSPIENKKPDFQEFLIIPTKGSVNESFEANKKAKGEAQMILKQLDSNFKSKTNDENAWQTSLNEKLVLDILYKIKEKFEVLDIGVDVAASSFYSRRKYKYENPKLDRDKQEQFSYLCNLIENFGLFYVEDPFEEDDFESFANLLKKFPDRLIVGDDLIVTNHRRLEKAIKMKSINGIIVKPNQVGSLLEVKRVCESAKKNNIKLIFSHRSGETNENILADLAFGFGADFFKCGITGKEREVKLKRLVEIWESFKHI